MNEPVNLGPWILEWSKIIMCEFWYDYVKPEYGENVKMCYMDTDSFILQIAVYCRYCKRCWSKIWNFKLWIRHWIRPKEKITIGLMKDD